MTACLSTQLETCALCQGACDNHKPIRNFSFSRTHLWPKNKTNGRLKGYRGGAIFLRFFFLPVVPLVGEEWARSVDSCLSFFLPSPPPGCCLVLGSQLFSSFVWRSVSGCWDKYTAWTAPLKTTESTQVTSSDAPFFLPPPFFLIRHESVFEQILCSSSLLPFPPPLPRWLSKKSGYKNKQRSL